MYRYCQILADLTNCEVFYKAQLPLNSNTNSSNGVDSSARLPVRKSTMKPTHTKKVDKLLIFIRHCPFIEYGRQILGLPNFFTVL